MTRTPLGTPHGGRTGSPDSAGDPRRWRRQRRQPHARGSRPGRASLTISTLLLVAAVLLVTAGILLLQSGRAPAAGQRTVAITVHHSRFQPGALRVEPGTTVRFVLRNTDPIDHEFIVGDEAVHQRHRVGRDKHHHGEVPGEISLPSGAQATTTFRFDRPGRFAYICHLPGHEAYGMVGVVEVG